MANAMTGKIEHVVILMLENRGFDHFMGWLYTKDDPPKGWYPQKDYEVTVGGRKIRPQDFEGLGYYDDLDGFKNAYRVEKDKVLDLPPRRGARSPKVPSVNPHEHFVHIMAQMYGITPEQAKTKSAREELIKKGNAYKVPAMSGFLQSFAGEVAEARAIKDPRSKELLVRASEIMDMYTPDQLPVLAGLARHYAISDLWFCSVPSQTNTNRAFTVAGTARGMATNGFYDTFWLREKIHEGLGMDTLPPDTRTMFNILSDNRVPWKYFWQRSWPYPPMIGTTNQYTKLMFPSLGDCKHDDSFRDIGDFFDLAAKGKLPAVSFIEPEWGGGSSWEDKKRLVGNEHHPVSDITVGEMFVKKVYDHLTSNEEAWKKTLLIITFDENGGTYDHFPPPPALPTGLDSACHPSRTATLDKTTNTEFGFEFDLYGVRVPTLLVSPYVPRSTVFRSPTAVPFDHTSIIATILDWQSIPRGLGDDFGMGARVGKAPTFDGVLGLKGPRTDLKFGARPSTNVKPLEYGNQFRLKYIGDPHSPSVARYVVAAELSLKSGGYYYPKLGLKGDAVKLRLAGGSGQIKNGDMVQIESPDMYSILQGNALTAPELGKNVYYSSAGKLTRQANWELWLSDNRERGEKIYPGDKVVFMAQLPVERPLYDPYMRLIPDAQSPEYLTVEAGEWAAWELEIG